MSPSTNIIKPEPQVKSAVGRAISSFARPNTKTTIPESIRATEPTTRPANKISRTQLTINGEITVPTSIQMMVYDQKKINGKLEDTHAFGMNDMKDYELGVNGKPTENVKLAVIPKPGRVWASRL